LWDRLPAFRSCPKPTIFPIVARSWVALAKARSPTLVGQVAAPAAGVADRAKTAADALATAARMRHLTIK
jgi:hypothetical protein